MNRLVYAAFLQALCTIFKLAELSCTALRVEGLRGGSLHCAALKRKGKGDDVTEDDMDAVVLAHNSTPPALI